MEDVNMEQNNMAIDNFKLHEHLVRQFTWSEKTFGPPDGATGVLDHIHKELNEIEENPDDVEEWIDVIILAFDGAFRTGHSAKEIIETLQAKQFKNEQRKWPDWRTAEPGKAIEHIKEE
jgi:hypothetical protein